MSKQVDLIEYNIMEIIQDSESPIGAIRIKKVLEEKDNSISEAKIGRILLKLEEDGLIEKEGSNGRVLTKDGRDKMVEFQYFFKSKVYSDRILSLITGMGMDEMLNHLDAREAMELKAVELVIKKVPDEELKALGSILGEQLDVLYNYKNRNPTLSQGSLDFKFHSKIIKLSGNPYIEAFYQLLRCSEDMQRVYEFIAGQGYIEDHSRIFEAISNRNLDEASKALRQHIEDVKKECIIYWENKKNLEKYLNIDSEQGANLI